MRIIKEKTFCGTSWETPKNIESSINSTQLDISKLKSLVATLREQIDSIYEIERFRKLKERK